MSLINQALRKAQQDRTPKRMATSQTADSPATPTGGIQIGLTIGGIAAFAILIGLVVGLTVVIFQKDRPPSDQLIADTTPMPANSLRDLESEAPTKATITPKQPIIAKQVVNSPIPVEATQENILDQLRLAREEAEAQATTDAAAAAEAQRIANLAPDEKIVEWLSNSKVTGVRMSTSGNSKAIINNEAYGEGEAVNYSMGLKLIVIQETRLLFEDANGKRYMKRL
jgi:hypothetical protein